MFAACIVLPKGVVTCEVKSILTLVRKEPTQTGTLQL